MEQRVLKKRSEHTEKRQAFPEGAYAYLSDRLRELKSLIRAMDKDMLLLYNAVDRAANGVDCFVLIYDRLGEIDDVLDKMWENASNGSKVAIESKRRRVQVRKDRERGHKSENFKIYPEDPAWRSSKIYQCPLCQETLLKGPLVDEYYCTYCARMIHEPKSILNKTIV